MWLSLIYVFVVVVKFFALFNILVMSMVVILSFFLYVWSLCFSLYQFIFVVFMLLMVLLMFMFTGVMRC